MRPHEQRVLDEKAELDARIAALEHFLPSGLFNGLDVLEQGRMKSQLVHMKAYSDVLGLRIAAFPK